MTDQTPQELGFRMPAEWEPHERTWMMWPSRSEVWDDMAVTKRNYADVAHAIRDFEPVTMVVGAQDVADARNILGSDIELFECPIDDSWARDAGPVFLKNDAGEKAGVSFQFNAWGGKYAPYHNDAAASDAILSSVDADIFSSELTAEGGGFHVDGNGTILTTRSCFPNENRNPDWSGQDIERELKDLLGGEKVIWLPGNPLEVETDGHVDIIAQFVAPGVVAIADEEDKDHSWHKQNAANIAAIDGQTDVDGNPIQLVKIPEATDALAGHEKFCRSYVNSYICNGAVVLPKFDVRQDGEAREIYQDLFPSREIVMVPIWAIGIGGGGIHCITQQEPAAL